MTRKLTGITAILFVILVFASIDAFGQGRGNNGRPSGSSGGRPSGAGQGGIDRGLGTASDRSVGRSDGALGNASNRSNGRSDTGLDRARMGGAPERGSNELRRYSGLSKRLETTPEALRARYDAALAANPDLKWGQFVAAHVVADNLGSRFPNITSEAILQGLADGNNFGRTLESLGLGEEQAEEAEKEAKRQIKDAKRQIKDGKKQNN